MNNKYVSHKVNAPQKLMKSKVKKTAQVIQNLLEHGSKQKIKASVTSDQMKNDNTDPLDFDDLSDNINEFSGDENHHTFEESNRLNRFLNKPSLGTKKLINT